MPQFPREISKWFEILYITHEKYTDNRWFTRVVNNWYQASYISNPMQHVETSRLFRSTRIFLYGESRGIYYKNVIYLIMQLNIYDKN